MKLYEKILKGELTNGQTIKINLSNNELTFEIL